MNILNKKMVRHCFGGVLLLMVSVFSSVEAEDVFGNSPAPKSVSSVDDVVGALGISGSLDDVIGGIGDINDLVDNIFGEFDLSSISSGIAGDNNILGCLAQNIDISNLLGGLDIDGLCGLLDIESQLGGDIFGGTTGCLLDATGVSDVLGLGSLGGLSSLCSGHGSGDTSGGDTSGGGSTSGGDTSGGGSTSGGGTLSSNQFDSVAVIATNVELDGTGGSTKTTKKPLGERKYPSGLTVNELKDTDGGYVAKGAKENPNSALGKMWEGLNVADQELQTMALKIKTGATAEDVRLPATIKKVEEKEDGVADVQFELYPNLYSLQNSIAKRVRASYASLEAETIEEYFAKEKKAFSDFVSKDKEIAIIKEKAYKAIEGKYAILLFSLKEKEGYMTDISETRARAIPLPQRNLFRWNSILVSNRNTVLKSRMAREKREMEEAIKRTVARAYPVSSIFRADIANKEIDAMLKAIDTAIK